MFLIGRHCLSCKQFARIEVFEGEPFYCPHCSNGWGDLLSAQEVFEHCLMCSCKQFYKQKDFNQALGCIIMLIGISLVPWTYGLSLAVFAFIDWLLHKKVPTIVVCYRCGSEFKGFKIPKRLKPFMHHIGLKYDKYR